MSVGDGIGSGGHPGVIDGIGTIDDDDRGTALVTSRRRQASRAAGAIGVGAVDESVTVIIGTVGAVLRTRSAASGGEGVDEQLAGVRGIEPETKTEVPGGREATVVIGEVVTTGGGTTAELTDDAVVLIEQRRSRRSRLGGSQVPIIHRHEIGGETGRIVFERDSLFLGIGVVDSYRTAR